MSDSESCAVNIGPRECGKRLRTGIAMVVVCIAIEAAFVSAEASQLWRLTLLPMLYVALTGILQAHEET